MFLNHEKAALIAQEDVICDSTFIRIFTEDVYFKIRNDAYTDGDARVEIYEVENYQDSQIVHLTIGDEWQLEGNFSVRKEAYISHIDSANVKAIHLGPGFYRVYSYEMYFLIIKEPEAIEPTYENSKEYYGW